MADSREYRSKFYLTSALFVGILIGILVVVYFLSSAGSLGRLKLDLTQDKIFTISDATRSFLKDLKDDIIVTYFCSDEVSSKIVNLKRDTLDMFRELETLSDGHFKYEVVAPEEEARKEAKGQVEAYFKESDPSKRKEPQQKESFEDMFMGGRKPKRSDDDIRNDRRKTAEKVAGQMKRPVEDVERQLLTKEFEDIYLSNLQKEGIYAVQDEERSGDKRTEMIFFTALQFKYLNKQPEVIPVYSQLQSLEYELANKVLKLTQKVKPKVAFFDGKKPEGPPPNPMNPMQRPPASDYSAIVGEFGELFDIDELSLKEGNSITDLQKRLAEDLKKTDDDKSADEKPKNISTLIVAQPDNLEARQVYEISKAVSEGIKTIFLVSNYTVDFSQQGMQNNFPITRLNSGLDDLYRSWGVTLGKDILCNAHECATIPVPQRFGGLRVMAPYPMPILLKSVGDSINPSHPLTNGIRSLVFPSSVGLTLNQEDLKKAGLSATTLATTGKESYAVQINPFEQDMFNRPKPASVIGNKELHDRREHKADQGYIEPKVLACLVDGKFPFKYQDQPIPDWLPKKDEDNGGGGPGGGPGFPGGIPGMPAGLQGFQGMQGGLPPGHPSPKKAAPPKVSPPQGAKGPRGPEEASGILLAQAPPVPAPAGAPQEAAKKEAPPSPAPAAPAAPAVPPPAAPPAAPAPVPAEPAPIAVPPGASLPAASPPAAVPPATIPTVTATPGEEVKKEEAKKEPEKAHVDLKENKVLILTSADMMQNDLLTQGNDYQPNGTFFYNAIENFGLDDRLLQIRRKELIDRRFITGAGDKAWWIYSLNLGVIPVGVGVFGLVRYLLRRAEAQSYERQQIEGKSS